MNASASSPHTRPQLGYQGRSPWLVRSDLAAESLSVAQRRLANVRTLIKSVLGTLLCLTAFAQDRGTFSGTVTDPAGAAVPNVKVGIVQISTNLRVDTVTNDV